MRLFVFDKLCKDGLSAIDLQRKIKGTLCLLPKKYRKICYHKEMLLLS